MFRFKLQPLLKFRKRQEEGKQREVAVINRELIGARNQISEFSAQRKEAVIKLTEISAHATGVNVIRLYEDFINGKDADIAWKEKEMESIDKKLADKQTELAEYVRRRRVLELLRNRQKEAYEKEENKKERIFTDEVATQLYFREAML
ncbi:MAG: flagellar export protein FliJ [Nitrospinota bacterium]